MVLEALAVGVEAELTEGSTVVVGNGILELLDEVLSEGVGTWESLRRWGEHSDWLHFLWLFRLGLLDKDSWLLLGL